MTLNLEADIPEQVKCLDESKWSPFETEVCMNIANAKFYAFVAESERIADLVRCKFLTQTTGADILHQAALYNSLYAEYGADRIQQVIGEAFQEAA